MKPRALAAEMVTAMKKEAERVWLAHRNELEVEDKQEGRKWVWDLVLSGLRGKGK